MHLGMREVPGLREAVEYYSEKTARVRENTYLLIVSVHVVGSLAQSTEQNKSTYETYKYFITDLSSSRKIIAAINGSVGATNFKTRKKNIDTFEIYGNSVPIANKLRDIKATADRCEESDEDRLPCVLFNVIYEVDAGWFSRAKKYNFSSDLVPESIHAMIYRLETIDSGNPDYMSHFISRLAIVDCVPHDIFDRILHLKFSAIQVLSAVESYIFHIGNSEQIFYYMTCLQLSSTQLIRNNEGNNWKFKLKEIYEKAIELDPSVRMVQFDDIM